MGTSISADSRLYTYRNGKKVYLKKEPDQGTWKLKISDMQDRI
ncbi:MAG TPA: hypothetical protein VGQ04_21365 [Chitinophagaceae bacterium]|jgi:subtilisin-like proprotein convertase family protein|nr:hypothetical protein [Chitinophagaceae bacterium]